MSPTRHINITPQYVVPTTGQFHRMVEEFYTASGISALMRSSGCWSESELSGDGEAASWYAAANAMLARTAEELSDLFIRYLLRAIWNELRHAGNETGYYTKQIRCEDFLGGWCLARMPCVRDTVFNAAHQTSSPIRNEFLKEVAWYAQVSNNAFDYYSYEYNGLLDSRSPVPHWFCCHRENPQRAMQLLRVAAMCYEILDWNSQFGGHNWSEITNIVISRLHALMGDTIVTPGRGVTRKLKYKDMKYNAPPAMYDVDDTYLMYGDPIVFVDAVLDLQHNTGSVLNKGYINCDDELLGVFQDKKMRKCPTEWAVGWDYVVERVLLRRGKLASSLIRHRNARTASNARTARTAFTALTKTLSLSGCAPKLFMCQEQLAQPSHATADAADAVVTSTSISMFSWPVGGKTIDDLVAVPASGTTINKPGVTNG